MDLVAGYDFVKGQKTMYELEGGPHFGNLAFSLSDEVHTT